MGFTLLIVLVTAVVSFMAFGNSILANKLLFYPYQMYDKPSEYYRFITSGFVHADWNHLIFNMITLYFFGQNVEAICSDFGVPRMFLVLYISGIIISSIPAFNKQKNNIYYKSLGASGGVAAILFATVYFEPWNKIYIIFIPIGIPSVIFAVLYLVYSAYMNKKGQDHVAHDAHIWGSVFGFIFAYLLDLRFASGHIFINELLHPGNFQGGSF